MLLPDRKGDEEEEAYDADFDPFAGGYPVPPMPGQRLPELTGATVLTSPPDDTQGASTDPGPADTPHREDDRA
jgi:NADH-quinone oxidoreductase subunit H